MATPMRKATSTVLKTIRIALKMLRWGCIIIGVVAAVYIVLWNCAVSTGLD